MWMIAQAFLRHKHLRKSNPLGRIDLCGNKLAAITSRRKQNFPRPPQAAAREMSTMKFKKGRLMGRPRKNRPLKLRITTPARAIDLSAFH
jgi:hypothetical protein